MEIEAYRTANRAGNYIVTQHGRRRMEERGVHLRDVINVIDGRTIIEEYPDDFPFPSCLILGPASDGRPLHVVASISDGMIYLITVYKPDIRLWGPDLRTRKEKSQ